MALIDVNRGLENPRTRKTIKVWGYGLVGTTLFISLLICIELVANGKHNKGPWGIEINIPPTGDTARKVNYDSLSHMETLEETYHNFLRNYPDKNTPVAVSFVGDPNAEMRRHKQTMLNLIAMNGYGKIHYEERYSLPAGDLFKEARIGLNDGAVVIYIPY